MCIWPYCFRPCIQSSYCIFLRNCWHPRCLSSAVCLCAVHVSKVPSYLNVVDIAGLVKGAHEGQGLGNAFLSHIRACDAVFHMTRELIHTHTHPFNGPLSRTTRVSQYQKGETNLDFTEARDSEWQWHQLGHMQVCTSLQIDNHASTPPLSYLQAGCLSCRRTNQSTEGNVLICIYSSLFV